MQYYQVPPDTRDKEKIFGGIFTLTQFAFIVVGVVSGGALGLLVHSLTKSIIATVLAFAIMVVLSLPFAFVTIRKMGDIELYRYLVYRYKYKHRTQHMTHVNINHGGK